MIQVIRANIKTINGKVVTEEVRDYNITLHSKEEYNKFRETQLELIKLEYGAMTQIFFTYKTI